MPFEKLGRNRGIPKTQRVLPLTIIKIVLFGIHTGKKYSRHDIYKTLHMRLVETQVVGYKLCQFFYEPSQTGRWSSLKPIVMVVDKTTTTATSKAKQQQLGRNRDIPKTQRVFSLTNTLYNIINGR